MATINEVARRAGVSAATVSYVMNGIRKVSSETEERVRQAARELRYTPNRAARSLVAGRSMFLGLVVPDICNPFFHEVVRTFQESANLAGMEAIIMNCNSEPQLIRSLLDRLISLQVAGVAFLTSRVDAAAKASLHERGIPAVYMDYGEAGPGISTISVDYRAGMLEAVAYLTKLGHQRLGLLGGPANGAAARVRKLAFLEATSAAGLEAHSIDSDFTVQGGYFSCARLLSSTNVTAVIAANDLMAIGAMHSASDRQLQIPRDLSIIGFDDIMFAQFTQPALTTVAVPRPEIGHLAYDCLATLMTDPDAGAIHQVTTSLIVRQTTAPPK